MSTSSAYRSMEEFNRRLGANEVRASMEMIARWLEIERRLGGLFDALIQEIAAEGIQTRAEIYRLYRYSELIRQAQMEIDQFEAISLQEIQQLELDALDLGFEAAVQSAYGEQYFAAQFDRAAVRNMVGLCADGQPLFSLLAKRALAPDAIEGLTRALVTGVGLGYNPRKIARLMMAGLTEGLNKALVIARTEMIRVFREATRRGYAGMRVQRYQRHCAHSDRTCLACIALDGKVYDTEQLMESHPQCRCFMVPIVDNQPDPAYGQLWFENLSSGAQQAIMGMERYNLWRAGIGIARMVRVRQDLTWGPTVGLKTIKELEKLVK